MHGSINRHRTIAPLITFVVMSAAGTASAHSNSPQNSSLLSGYGGPGQGSQAILGSALLNGPGSGGGNGGSATISTLGQITVDTGIPQIGPQGLSGNGGSIALNAAGLLGAGLLERGE